MKVWVIGAHSMLGKILIPRLEAHGLKVVGTTRAQADVTDYAQLLQYGRGIQPTHLINCAAFTDVDRAEVERENAFLINATGAENAAKVATALQARLLHISTDFVFRGDREESYKETDPCDPINFYGWSKYQGELLAKAQCPPVCIVRTSWLFGGEGKNLISNLLNWFQTKPEIQVVSDQYGKPTYCADLAEALIKLLNHEGIFHFSNEGKASRYEIACEILTLLQQNGVPVLCKSVVPVSSSQFSTIAPRPTCSLLDTQRFESCCGEKPRPWNIAFLEYLESINETVF